jgi:hypothetical protein
VSHRSGCEVGEEKAGETWSGGKYRTFLVVLSLRFLINEREKSKEKVHCYNSQHYKDGVILMPRRRKSASHSDCLSVELVTSIHLLELMEPFIST